MNAEIDAHLDAILADLQQGILERAAGLIVGTLVRVSADPRLEDAVCDSDDVRRALAEHAHDLYHETYGISLASVVAPEEAIP